MRFKHLCYSSWNLFLFDALALKFAEFRFFLLWHTTALFFQHESHSCQLGDRQDTLFRSLEVSKLTAMTFMLEEQCSGMPQQEKSELRKFEGKCIKKEEIPTRVTKVFESHVVLKMKSSE